MMAQAQTSGRWSLAEGLRVDDLFVPRGEQDRVVVVTSQGRIIKVGGVRVVLPGMDCG